MFRSKEFQLHLFFMSLVGVAAVILAAFFSVESAIVTLFSSLFLIGLSVIFTRTRYQEIKKLSGYLREIASGKVHLDVRDNREGELSILKNEIYKVTRKLSEHSKQLDHDKRKLSDAISDISHQLKTPLTSMIILVDLLQNSDMPAEKRQEFIRKISNQLERMDWLISTLLKLSKIDAGTVQFRKEKVYVKSLIERSVEPMIIPMEIKEQTLQISGDEDVFYRGDFNWTVEAITNILKNCVEHTPTGGKITIHFTENPLYTEITISDNGKGIAKEDLPYIFKRFYKGKNAGEDSVGIGLAFSYQIVTNQGGDIQVRSSQEEGTRFTIKFFKQIV